MTRACCSVRLAALLCVASGCAASPYPAPQAEPAPALRPRGREPIDSGDDAQLAALELACRSRSSRGAVALGLRVAERLRSALGPRCELDTVRGDPLRIRGRCGGDALFEAGAAALAKATAAEAQALSRVEVVIAGDAAATEHLQELATALRATPIPTIDLAALAVGPGSDVAWIDIALQLVPNPEAASAEGSCPPPGANRVDLLQCLESCARQAALAAGALTTPSAGTPSLFGSPVRDDPALFAAGVQLLELASSAERHLDLGEACRVLGSSAAPCAASAVQNLGASGSRDIQIP